MGDLLAKIEVSKIYPSDTVTTIAADCEAMVKAS